jgi:hypothetical protein
LSNLHGDKIEPMYLCKRRVINYVSKSNIRWPRQQAPELKYFSTWVNILKKICRFDSNGILINKLGLWMVNPMRYYEYKVLIHSSTNHIIVKEATSDTIWKQLNFSHNVRSKRYYTKSSIIEIDKISWNEYCPIEYEENEKFTWTMNRNYYTTQSIKKNVSTLIPASTMTNLQTYIIKQPHGLQRLIQNTSIKNEELLLHNFKRGITFCSDGGAKNGKGSFGVTSIINKYVALECYNRIPETYKEANCHRSEALGVLASLVIIDSIDQYISRRFECFQQPYQIRLICDNESVVRTINKIKNNKLTLRQHYSPNNDVLRAIKVKLLALKIKRCKVLILHIKGHQDKHNKSLSTDEIMNVEA